MKNNFCGSSWAILSGALHALLQGEGEATVTTVLSLESQCDSANYMHNSSGSTVEEQIAVLPIRGIILPYRSVFAEMLGATCLDAISEEFCKALHNPDIRAIILDIDSPGGMVTGVHAFSQQVFAARSIKPIISRVSGMAASAAYWIASAASQVFIDPTASVGSIGVVTTYQDSSEKQKKEGVQKIEIVSSQSPQKRPDILTEEGRSQMQVHVDTLASVFIEDVALYRNVSADTVLSDFGQGGLVLGTQAVHKNMADSLMTLPALLNPSLLSTTPTLPGANRMSIELTSSSVQAFKEEPLSSHTPSALTYEQGFEAGLLQGRHQERARIQAIEAQSLPGHEGLISTLKYDGVSQGSDAALQILAAEKAQRSHMAQALVQDAPPPLLPMLEVESAQLSPDAQVEVEWQQSAVLQAEFHSFAAYLSYRKAEMRGDIKQQHFREKPIC